MGSFKTSVVSKQLHQFLPIQLVLRNVILGAELKGMQRGPLIVKPCQRDDGSLGIGLINLGESLQTMRIREKKIQKHNINLFGRKPFQCSLEVFLVDKVKFPGSRLF